MKIRFFIFLLLAAVNTNAQFYYNDIYQNKVTNYNWGIVKENKISKTTLTKLDPENIPTEDFLITKDINANFSIIVTTSQTYNGSKFISTSNYKNGKISKIEEEKSNIIQTVDFDYSNDNLASITTISNDSATTDILIEEHKFLYNNQNILVQMLKIKNETDTTLINFIADEKGNIVEEQWLRNGRKIETYYYYYNSNNLLTDIVRFNLKLGKLLPEYLFEYNEKNEVFKTIQVPYGTSNYTIWVHYYLPTGLKDKELCYNKANELQGKLVYKYN